MVKLLKAPILQKHLCLSTSITKDAMPVALPVPSEMFYNFKEKWPASAFLRLQKTRKLQQGKVD